MTNYTATEPVIRYTGREYLRVSKDRRGRQASVTEQHEDNAANASGLGVAIQGKPYNDNDRSASRYATKTRDDFARLISDLENDLFAEDVLIIWESSRGSRRVGEWVHLIDLCEERGKLIMVTTHRRVYDPRDGRDRRTLIEDAVDSEYESYKTHLRVKRHMGNVAAQGRPHGKAPDGYMPVYNERTGELLTWVEDPARSMIVKELFRLLRAGHALRAIAQNFEKRGWRGKSGVPFSPQTLRAMALRYAYAGYRVYQPQETGAKHDRPEAKPTFVEATWAKLIDRETFWTVRETLANPERRTVRDGRARHVLTRIIVCDVCDSPMRHRRKDDRYECEARGCVSLPRADVDEVLIGEAKAPGLLLRFLASDQVYQVIGRSPEEDARLAEIGAELAELRVEMSRMEATDPETAAEARMLGRGIHRLDTKINDLEAEERRLSAPEVLRDLIEPGADVAQRWEAAPIAARRRVARLLLVSGILGQVRITHSPVPGRWAPAVRRIRYVKAA
jgi:DNA invertase Pin-like site-specific DNA recombinase